MYDPITKVLAFLIADPLFVLCLIGIPTAALGAGFFFWLVWKYGGRK